MDLSRSIAVYEAILNYTITLIEERLQANIEILDVLKNAFEKYGSIELENN